MEGDMVNSFPEHNNKIVIDYFNDNFPSFEVLSKTLHGPYWGVVLLYKEIKINVSGDIGFGIEIYIDKSKFDLWEYDRSVNDFMKTSDKNILYQLNILKRFLNDALK